MASVETPAAVAMAPSVSVRGLELTYPTGGGVHGVSFEVRRGEIFGLLGPNGAGKTTTLECIVGLRRPQAGTIDIAGLPQGSRAHIAGLVGVHLQHAALIPELTVRETLSLLAIGHAHPREAAVLLSELGLEHVARQRVATLSGGERQRLHIAAALLGDPPIVVLDEPTASLDPVARRTVRVLCRHLRAQGRTVILATHYLEEAEALCDRVAVMDRGRLAAVGEPSELLRGLALRVTVSARVLPPLRADDVRGLRSVEAVVDDEDGRVRLTTRDAARTIAGLVFLAQQVAADVREVSVAEPRLEDVFFELTKRRPELG